MNSTPEIKAPNIANLYRPRYKDPLSKTRSEWKTDTAESSKNSNKSKRRDASNTIQNPLIGRMSTVGGTDYHAVFRNTRRSILPGEQCEVIVGHTNVVRQIERAFYLFNKFEGSVNPKNVVRSVLLCGPPGVGKTNVLMNISVGVAKLLKRPISFFYISAAEMLGKYVGESEKLVTALYDVVEESAPSLLVIDEVEGLMGKRDESDSGHTIRFKNHLLSEMEGHRVTKNVVLVATTNRGQELDEAFIRRFKARFYMRPPTDLERFQIFQKFCGLNKIPVRFELNDAVGLRFVRETSGFTGDDICSVATFMIDTLVKEKFIDKMDSASHSESNDDLTIGFAFKAMTEDDIFNAIKRVRKSVDPKNLKESIKWGDKYCEPSDCSKIEPVAETDQDVSCSSSWCSMCRMQ